MCVVIILDEWGREHDDKIARLQMQADEAGFGEEFREALEEAYEEGLSQGIEDASEID